MQPLSTERRLSEEDYNAIEAAVMETARGRWFLAEYARRNRNADTDTVLAALRRLERMVASAGSFDRRDEVTRGMADIARAIAAVEIIPAESTPTESRLPNAETSGDRTVAGEAIVEPEALAADREAMTLVHAGRDDEGAEQDPEIPPIEAAPEFEAVREPDEAVLPPVEIRSAEGPGIDADELVDMPYEPQIAADVVAGVAHHEAAGATETSSSDPFPITELDEAAADALLTRPPPRAELIVPPTNLADHLAVERRMYERVAADALQEALEEATRNTPPPAASVTSSLVTFIDEEPGEDGESVFSAPLRLELEDVSAETDGELMVAPPSAAPRTPTPPRMTIAEIEAMPFAKKAALFS